MTARRRIWITGIGLITAIGTGRDAFRAGLRAGRSRVRTIDRFDPSPFRSQVAAQVDDFDPLAWMPPKTARQLDRFSQFGLVAGRLALDDAGLTPGASRRGRSAADRDLSRVGAGRHRLRRGPARALPRARDQGGRPEPGACRVRRSGAGQPRHRARRPRADPVDRELVRLRGRRARRGARRPARRPGRRRDRRRRRDPAQRRSRSGRSTSSVRCRAGTTASRRRRARPFDAGRDGFVMGEGATLLVARGGRRRRARAAPRPTPSSSATGRRPMPTTWSSRGADGSEAARAARSRSTTRGVQPDEIDYVNAHASSTPIGDVAEARAIAPGPRGSCEDRPGQRHEGAVRAPARGVGGDRGGDLRAGHPRRLGAGARSTSSSRIPMRPRSCRAC